MKALTVRMPWAWLLFHGKPVENRDWCTGHRGPLVIHASAAMTRGEWGDTVYFISRFDPDLARKIPTPAELKPLMGKCLGIVHQVDCVTRHHSPFFQGKFGHVYESAELFEAPIPAKGALGLWEWSR